MNKQHRRTLPLKAVLLSGAAALALVAAPAVFNAAGISPAFAEKAEGAGGHGQGGQGAGGQKGQGAGGQKGGQGGRSLEDIFRDVSGDDGEDSDAPEWAGEKGGKSGMGGGKPAGAGAKKGDLFGDLWVILRDENGVPILTDEGFVQPLDADGNPIPLDEEGHPIDATLTQEVELGRLNVGRAPTKVLDRRAEEVITLLNQATDLSTDAAGRLVLTVDGEEKTIDSPLENLAIYVALMTQGTIPGVTDLPGDQFDFMVDGTLTAQDLAASGSFLAAATDKTGVFSVDEIAYINAFLGINTVSTGSVSYSNVDFSEFSYDREAAYSDTTVDVLVQQSDGVWVVSTVNVYDTIFGSQSYTGSGDLSAYTQSADDARAVINFIHEYEVPADDISDVGH